MDDLNQFKPAIVFPLILAALTGSGSALLAWVIGVWLEWTRIPLIMVTTAVLVFLWTWIWLMRKRLGWIEQLLGIDLNRDGVIGHPSGSEPVRVEIIDNQPGGYLRGDFLDLDIDRERLAMLGLLLDRGATFSHASLAGAGKILSRSEYETLREAWLMAGLVRWVNDRSRNQGLELTGKGRALARGFASMTNDIPTLDEGGEPIDLDF